MVLPDILQSSVQQDPFGPQFFLHAFWVDGFIVPQHRQDSAGKGRNNFKFSIFKCWNAKGAELYEQENQRNVSLRNYALEDVNKEKDSGE